MYQSVIFDFGGVMHVSVPNASEQEIVRVLMEDGHMNQEEATELYKISVRDMGVGTLGEEAFWKKASAHNPQLSFERLQEAWRKRLREDAMAYPEMFALVSKLKEAGIKTYVFSNTIAPHADVMRKKDMYTTFDQVFLSHEIKLRKPDPSAYKYVLEKVNLLPQDVIFIDDFEENLIPAEELGITTILAQNPKQVIMEINRLFNLSSDD